MWLILDIRAKNQDENEKIGENEYGFWTLYSKIKLSANFHEIFREKKFWVTFLFESPARAFAWKGLIYQIKTANLSNGKAINLPQEDC